MIDHQDSLKMMIAQHFNQAANTYDKHCGVQLHTGNLLLEYLKPFIVNTNHIIDLGCGTGLITQQLANHYDYEHFDAIDIASQLLVLAQDKLQKYNIKVYAADFDQHNLAPASVNLAFSNMALQWSMQLAKTLTNIYQQLTTDGVLAFSMPVHGTFAQLFNVAKCEFYSVKQIIQLLRQAGFNVCFFAIDTIHQQFSSPVAALKSLKAIGANCTARPQQHGLRGNKFLENCFKRDSVNDNYQLSYVIGYFIASKVTHEF